MSAVPTSPAGIEAALEDLRQAQVVLLADSQPASVRVAERIALLFQSASTDLTVEQALGLQGASGFGWKSVLRRTRRDELIRAIATHHFAGKSTGNVAKEIAREVARTSGARRPLGADLPGSLRAMVRELIAVTDTLSPSTIERVLTREGEANQRIPYVNHYGVFEPRQPVGSTS